MKLSKIVVIVTVTKSSKTVQKTPKVSDWDFILFRQDFSFNVSAPLHPRALTSALYALAAMLRAATPRTATIAAAELAAAGAAEMLRVNHLPRDVPVPAIF